VLKGGRCSVSSEVYALGVSLHSLLTGHLPFRWEDHAGFAKLKAAALAGPPDIRAVAPHVDLPLARIVRKATAQRPEVRYGSASEMDAALGRLPRPDRDIAVVSPHPDAFRCWEAVPSAAAGGPTSVHVCVIAKGRRFDVRTRHVPSGNRIVACCGNVTSARLPVFLRSVFGTLG
jgi:hypothetical protein